jgi:hypothetical protein
MVDPSQMGQMAQDPNAMAQMMAAQGGPQGTPPQGAQPPPKAVAQQKARHSRHKGKGRKGKRGHKR